MKSKKIAKLGLLSVIMGLCFSSTALMSWERKSPDYDRCSADGISNDRCDAQTEEDNQHDFEEQLRTKSYTIYSSFTPEQKLKAMDYADNNQMSPDDAVAKVKSER